MTWRQRGTLPYALCLMSHHAAQPVCGLAVLVGFRCAIQDMQEGSQCDASNVFQSCHVRLRSILWLWLGRDSEQPVGGPGKVVCIEETFHFQEGGFQGRSISGKKPIILGMTEKATGRIFCLRSQIVPTRPCKSTFRSKLFLAH